MKSKYFAGWIWQVDRGDVLPLGIPQLMMALTRDGQLNESLAQGKKGLPLSLMTKKKKKSDFEKFNAWI